MQIVKIASEKRILKETKIEKFYIMYKINKSWQRKQQQRKRLVRRSLQKI